MMSEENEVSQNRRRNIAALADKSLSEEEKQKNKREKEIESLYERSKVEFQNALNLDEPKITFFKIPLILVASCFFSFMAGYFNFSILLMFVIMYGAYFVFSRSIERFKKSMQVLVFKSERRRQISDLESVEWINFAIGRVWDVIESEVCKEVFRKVNPILMEKCPSFLGGLCITEFTLGSLPPVIKGISFDSKREKNIISFETELFFVPLETGHGPAAFLMEDSANWNSRIVISARFGLALKGRGIDVPVLVQNLSFYGRAKIVMQLSKDLNNPLKYIEFCFLSQPQVDFDLSPLKAIDLMNLPGLNSFIHNLIDSNLEKHLVDPNSIKIDLRKKIKKDIVPRGIIMLHIYSMFNKTDESCIAEIDIDGRRLFMTQQREGTEIVFNEYFYLILNSKDEMLNIIFRSRNIQAEHKYGTAGICLKKLKGIGCILQSSKIWKKGITKSVLDTDVKFFPVIEGPSLPEKHISGQAIYVVTVQYIENLQAQKKPRTKFYNSSVQVMVCNKLEEVEKNKSESPFELVSAALKVSGTVTRHMAEKIKKHLKAGFNSIVGQEKVEDAEILMEASSSTFFLGKTRTIMETRSPVFEEKFEIFSRHIHKDCLYLTVIDQQDCLTEVIGHLEVPLKHVFNGTEEIYKIKGAQSGRIKLSYNVHYITPFISPFKKYKTAVRMRIDQLVTSYDEGIFYAVIKNENESFFVDSFCFGDLPINREIIVPIEENEATLKIYLFRENTHESEYIGSGHIETIPNTHQVELKDKDYTSATLIIEVDTETLTGIGCNQCTAPENFNSKIEKTEITFDHQNKSVLTDQTNLTVNDSQSEILKEKSKKPSTHKNDLECVLHTENINEMNPCESSMSDSFHKQDVIETSSKITSKMFHVLQVCFKHFEHIHDDFFIEFVCDGEIIKKSSVIKVQSRSELSSVEKQVLGAYEHCRLNSNCEVFTLLCGQSPVLARLRTAEFGKKTILGECFIPKRCFDDKVSLGKDNSAQLTVCSQKAPFKWKDYFKIGFLEIRVLNAFKIRGVESDGTSDPYVKVYLNNKKILKTKFLQGTINPVWNENVLTEVNMMVDTLRFEVIDWNRIESNQIISFVEIPLYFLTEGFTEVNLHLIDALKMRTDGSILHLGFVFNKEIKDKQKNHEVFQSDFIRKRDVD
ncbi:Ca2+-dependent lipid-binding protein CLB1/vesicle protein vp115/Granuphilin A [Pseudoloma neurophilia]|uniref:Ca2+-dependent lipid-binding protein CLB1/vesicle protein vp115/Granuphilin A n=1 Tax=Pseudoloma neurophilia TaxID=146866 RepID=A0A0R0M333_9MICR|nr:Ca2+-dependent lipid-binding protein CLB1/vesicle protein vp115/Granuphilin A [Pseudoloma neurophilia]